MKQNERRARDEALKTLQSGLEMRMATVVVVSPLQIQLAGSPGTYTPKQLASSASAGFAVGAKVAVLVWGNDLLVLGAIV